MIFLRKKVQCQGFTLKKCNVVIVIVTKLQIRLQRAPL